VPGQRAHRAPTGPVGTPDGLSALQRQLGNAVVSDIVNVLRSPAIQRVAETEEQDRRPWVPNAQVPARQRWFADDALQGRVDGIVLSGHGSWSNADGYFRVPAGTQVYFYTLLGQTITDDLGGRIELGQASGASVEQGRHPGSAEIYVGGRSAPDPQLHTPLELTVRGSPVVATRTAANSFDVELNPGTPQAQVIQVANLGDPRLRGHTITVNGQVRLSDLLAPNMGPVHFAACRFTDSPRGGTRNQEEGLGP
jgi:hypothetical protein